MKMASLCGAGTQGVRDHAGRYGPQQSPGVLQFQQQLQVMQPSNQSSISQQGLQSSRNQSPWAGTVPPTAANPFLPGGDVPTAPSGNSSTPMMTTAVTPGKCNWTEHTSPDGYKYYYMNSTTGESKWEKPEELVLYQQQQQQLQGQQPKPPHQHPQVQHPQSESVWNVPQRQIQIQNQIQTQLQSQNHPQQLQQYSHPLSYPSPGATLNQTIQESGYTRLPVIAGSNPMNDLTQFQHGQQSAKDWMWKNKPAGM